MNKTNTRHEAGDGPPCAEDGEHGKTYVMSSGRLWCPVSNALFDKATYDEDARAFIPGSLVRAGDHPRPGHAPVAPTEGEIEDGD